MRLFNYSDSKNTCGIETESGVRLYYSYETLVAFRVAGVLVVHENIWSRTTGKHLKALDGGDKAGRVTKKEFAALYKEKVLGLEPFKKPSFDIGVRTLRLKAIAN